MKVKRISEIKDITSPISVATNITYQVQVTCKSEGKVYDLEITPETIRGDVPSLTQCRCSVCAKPMALPDITAYLLQSINTHPSSSSPTLLSMRLRNAGDHDVVIKSKPTKEDYNECLELLSKHPNEFTILHIYHKELLRAYEDGNEKQLLDFDMTFNGGLSNGT